MEQKNTFTGLNYDLPEIETPPNIITDGLNVSIVTNNGNELLLQAQSSNRYLNTTLSGDFIPLCTKTFNNINYTVAIQRDVDGYWITQIGSYPSPDYTIQPDEFGNTTGKMLNIFQPFTNYLDESIDNPTELQIQASGNYRPFITKLFNHRPDFPCELEIQASYDDTVNLIITDNNNTTKIVNSRFSVYENNNFKIYNRKGNKDTNLYNKYHFNNILNHIPVTNKILKVDFVGFGSGEVKVGNYRYYFKYVTADGNETDIVNQSFTIPVYIGDKVNSIRGGTTNEPSNKAVKLFLDNIDQSYSYIKVYFSYATGNTISYYKILSNYSILDTNMTITIIGSELVSNLGTNEELNNEYSNVKTWRTQTQIDDRLFIANIKQKVYNKDVFETFARKIKIGHQIEELSVKNTNNDANISDLFTDNNIQDTYRYANNVYEKLGYWRGESYPFGVVFILKDGSETAVFPIHGIDNQYNNADYNASGFVQPSGSVNPYPFDDITGRNYAGIYRFPTNEALDIRLLDNNKISVLGVVFEINDAINDQSIYAQILAEAIGLYYVRGERVSDVITQGYILPTINSMKSFSGTDFDYSDFDVSLISNINNGTFDINHKVFPLVRGYYESPRDTDYIGVFTSRFNGKGNTLSPWNPRYYGFYSPDYFVDESKYSQLFNTKKYYSKEQFIVKGTLANYQKLKSPISGFVGDLSGDRYYPTYGLYKTHTTQLTTSGDFLPLISNFTPGYVFSSLSEFGTAENAFNPSTTGNKVPVRLNWNTYVGLKYETPYLLTDIINQTSSNLQTEPLGIGNNDINLLVPYTLDSNTLAYSVNLYPNNHLRLTSDLKNIYNPDNISYKQITPKYYFSQQQFLNSDAKALDTTGLIVSGTTLAFDGDCFINVVYRRLYSTLNSSQGNTNESAGIYVQPVGQVISIVTESNNNAALREKQVLDVVEGERSFLPFTSLSNNLDSAFGSYRNNTRPESYAYNYGSSYVKSDISKVNIPSYAAFTDTRFETRIMYSANHVNAGFYNGYRNIKSSWKEDYPRNFGEIVRIHAYNGGLIVVFEKGVGYIGINQQTVTGNNPTGSIIIDSQRVLYPKMSPISEEYGSTYQWSVEKSDNTIYGVDVNQSKIWRIEGKSLKLLSDMSIQSWLRPMIEKFKNKSPVVSILDVRTHYDTYKKDIDFVFYDNYTFYDSVNPEPVSTVCTCPEGSIAIINDGSYSCAKNTIICPSGYVFNSPYCVQYDYKEPVFKGLEISKYNDGFNKYLYFKYDPQYYNNVGWGGEFTWSLCISNIILTITNPIQSQITLGPGYVNVFENILIIPDPSNNDLDYLLRNGPVQVSGKLEALCNTYSTSCSGNYLCYQNPKSPVFNNSDVCPSNYNFIDNNCQKILTSTNPIIIEDVLPCGCSCNNGFDITPSGCEKIEYSCPSGTYYPHYQTYTNVCVNAHSFTPIQKGLTFTRANPNGFVYSQLFIDTSDYPGRSFYDVGLTNGLSFKLEFKVNGVYHTMNLFSYSIQPFSMQFISDVFIDLLPTPQLGTGVQDKYPSKITNLTTGQTDEFEWNVIPSCPSGYVYVQSTNLCVEDVIPTPAHQIITTETCISNTSKRYACKNGVAVEDPNGSYSSLPICEKPDNTRIKSYNNITFNENLNKWVTRNSWIPIMSFNLNGQFITWNLLKETPKFWLHNNDAGTQENGLFYNFYGDQYTMELEFVVIGDTQKQAKMYDNMEIVGNILKTPPAFIISTNEKEVKNQKIIERVSGNILRSNYEHRENIDLVVLGKNLIEYPSTQILIPTTDTRIRGKFCKFRIIYDSGKYTIIQSINTIGRLSYS